MPTLARHDTTDEVEPRLLAGKYHTVEQLEQGYVSAQRKLGRLGNEIGELRRENERLEEDLAVHREFLRRLQTEVVRQERARRAGPL